jgi:peptide/nickel transport system ATP-binding protein
MIPFNPWFSVEQWIRKPLDVHDIDNYDEYIYEVIERAELTPSEKYGGEHSHEFSEGERQHVSIA